MVEDGAGKPEARVSSGREAGVLNPTRHAIRGRETPEPKNQGCGVAGPRLEAPQSPRFGEKVLPLGERKDPCVGVRGVASGFTGPLYVPGRVGGRSARRVSPFVRSGGGVKLKLGPQGRRRPRRRQAGFLRCYSTCTA